MGGAGKDFPLSGNYKRAEIFTTQVAAVFSEKEGKSTQSQVVLE